MRLNLLRGPLLCLFPSTPLRLAKARAASCAVLAGILCLAPTAAWAGEARLKNGTTLRGTLVPLQEMSIAASHRKTDEIKTYPILMIDENGMIRNFVTARNVAEANRDVELAPHETFNLKVPKQQSSQMVATVGTIREITPFDEYGRRRVTLDAGKKKPMEIIQAISQITPQFVKVKGITYSWEFGIPTRTLPPETLDVLLRRAIDPNNPNDRLAIARFYLQAENYFAAQDELASIRRDFSQLAKTADEVSLELRQMQAQHFLDELNLRKSAGQYRLAYEGSQKFPVRDISGAILRDVRAIATDYEEQMQRIEQVKDHLGRLQAELPVDVAARVAPLRAEVSELLHPATLDRLAAFLNLVNAENLQPDEKLALAYSGWLLGSTNAISELDGALRLWQARFLVRQFLRTDAPRDREELLAQFDSLEGVGARQIAQMLPLLPPAVDTPGITPGQTMVLEIPQNDGSEALKYAVLLPIEYDPSRAYPLIISLRPAGRPIADAISWWGGGEGETGQSQRHGYIVIAPDYAGPEQDEYDYGVHAHRAVVQSLLDARKRFHVDSDRVFLAGHGMGGDATFDIGFAHPDLFAGIMPICGTFEKYCKYYWRNADHLPIYMIGGEFDRETVAINAPALKQMIIHGYDLIYAEHVGHGHENFHSEIEKLFDWMSRLRRYKNPQDIEIRTLRLTDNRFWWWQISGFPETNVLAVWQEGRKRITPLRVRGSVLKNNSIDLHCGAGEHILRLSPDIIDFEKRVMVRQNQSLKWNDFLTPSVGDMLEDFRIWADRQQLTWKRLEF